MCDQKLQPLIEVFVSLVSLLLIANNRKKSLNVFDRQWKEGLKI